MAIVQLHSNNPNFSFLIRKNPASGMMLRGIRKGLAYGWYSEGHMYNVYFKDADSEVSYKQYAEESFEYMNVSRYNSPLFPLNAINEYFSTPLKKQHDRDTAGYEHSFFINMIHIEHIRYIHFFEKHLPHIKLEIVHLAHKSYALTITTEQSLYILLHTVSVICLFLALHGQEYIDISDSIIEKYIKSVNIIDAPYYIRSLFVRNFLSSKDFFNKYKSELEQSERYSIEFAYGGTAQQRRNYISSLLLFNKSIVDVGCGEGFYAIPYAGKLEESYYAIDIDNELLEQVKRKAEKKQLDNIVTFPSIELFLDTYNGEQVDVILTEVVEHMGVEEAGSLIRLIATRVHYDQFIITTPNADFNHYYALSHYRHVDHQWEMGADEFKEWMNTVIADLDVRVEFIAIGDTVNGVRTTQGAVLRKGREAIQ